MTRLLDTMKEAALHASELQKAEFRLRAPGWGDTKEAHDFVSFVDVESERRIRTILERDFGEAAFFGEETEQNRGPGYTWIVDPLDGTTNYLSGYDHWSISIALWDQSGPVLGLVYKPSNDESFHAERDKGAWHNGKKLMHAEGMDPSAALIATGTPYRSPDTQTSFFTALKTVLGTCRDVRRSGSAALDLCYTAAGFFQGFWEVDLQPYDVAAGLLLLQETGQRCTTFSGTTYDPFKHRSLVCGRPGVYEKLAAAVNTAYQSMQ